MSASILVATPQPAVGELLRFSLEESSKYRVRLAQNGHEAMAAAGRIKFDLAILDDLLSDPPRPALANALQAANAGIRLVVIPPENEPVDTSTAENPPHAILNLPFYTPDLYEMLDRLLAGAAPAVEDAQPAQPADSTAGQPTANPLEMAARLQTILKEGSSRQALVVRERQLWSSAGSLEPRHQQVLVETLNRAWDPLTPNDIVRYVRLPDSGEEVLLYATSLAHESLLALVYDSKSPLTRIHSQAIKAVQELRACTGQPSFTAPPNIPASENQPIAENPESPSLAAPLPELPDSLPVLEPSELSDQFTGPAPSGQAAADLLKALEAEGKKASANAPNLASAESEPLTAAPGRRETSEPIEEDEGPEVSLSDLLAAMPPPNPEERSLAPGIEWVTEAENEQPGENDFLFPWEQTVSAPASLEDTQPVRIKPAAEQVGQPTVETASLLPGADANPSAQLEPAETQPPEPESLPEKGLESDSAPEAENQPAQESPAPIQDNPSELSPLEADFTRLAYTCLLIPSQPETTISEALAERLAEWLAQVCQSNDWRLLGQSIQPDRMQWSVQVSPMVPPGSIVRQVRQFTNPLIQNEFSAQAAQTPQGPFWAPAYLILSGLASPDDSQVQNFLEHARPSKSSG